MNKFKINKVYWVITNDKQYFTTQYTVSEDFNDALKFSDLEKMNCFYNYHSRLKREGWYIEKVIEEVSVNRWFIKERV